MTSSVMVIISYVNMNFLCFVFGCSLLYYHSNLAKQVENILKDETKRQKETVQVTRLMYKRSMCVDRVDAGFFLYFYLIEIVFIYFGDLLTLFYFI